jgi:hypothetical protein
MAWVAPEDQIEQGLKLKAEYKIADPKHMTSCSVCHR